MSNLKKREEISNEFKWNLKAICESDENWQQRMDALAGKIAEIGQFAGKMGDDAQTFLAALKASDDAEQELYLLYCYANLKGDEDTAQPTYQGMRDKAQTAAVSLAAAASFMNPEITAIGNEKIAQFVADTPELKIYKHTLEDLFRKQKHILSPEMEQVLAKASEIGGAASDIFDMLTQTDMTFGIVKDSKGDEHEVTAGRFGSLMQNSDRTLRKNVHTLYYDTYIAKKNTIAQAYNYAVKNDKFTADMRNYASSLDAALFAHNIPKEIYTNLIETIGNNIHLFHRYLELRKRCLGVDTLHFYDIYAPIVKDANVSMNWDEAKKAVLEGVAALGEEYQNLVKRAYDENWIDVYENKGKATGAYCWGSYGMKHPYILMNYDDTISDMFVLAHEMGHAMHSHYTHRHQPYVSGNYTIFLAEVASTVNEALVMEHMLKNTDSKAEKTKYLYLLNEFLEGFKGTFFRQTMFAEFEMLAHEMAQNGEPLNSSSLNLLYENLLKKYFGDKIVIDEKIVYEWSRIPHFYRSFYVYQYATGYASAMAFAKAIKEEGQPAADRLLNMLKSGSSDYSVELLKQAGVDMTSPKPIQDAMDIFEGLLDRFEDEMEN